MNVYSKPHLSFADQVALLESRGLRITDPEAAANLLSVIGYYRLSGYWYPYRRVVPGQASRADQFVDGASFEQVVRLYDVDRRLKLMVLAAIERVQVALRVKIGFTLGRRGAYAHHSRLWNRNLVSQIAPRHLRGIPQLVHVSGTTGDSHFRIYSTLCILAFPPVALRRRIRVGSICPRPAGDGDSPLRTATPGAWYPSGLDQCSPLGVSRLRAEGSVAMDVTVLCDAVAVFPEEVSAALPRWGREQQEWTVASMPGNVAADGGWWLHFHSYLVTSDAGAVLVDTGIGPAGGEAAEWLGTAGRLPSLLEAAGVRADEIDTVVLTHIHLDHAGWNMAESVPRFANATYVVQQAELEHSRGTATYERLIKPLGGQLRAVDGEVSLAGGLRLLPTPGHTPGHQCVVTERVVLGGDVLVHPAQARWPELTYVYERDPAVAVTSRREVLALAAATGVPIAAAHPHTALTGAAMPLPALSPGGAACPPHKL